MLAPETVLYDILFLSEFSNVIIRYICKYIGISANMLCIIALVLCSVALLTQLLPDLIADQVCFSVYNGFISRYMYQTQW